MVKYCMLDKKRSYKIMRILVSQINPTIGDLTGNTQKIFEGIGSARKKKADLVIFPELCICGYPPEDFLLLPHFIEAIQKQLEIIIEASAGLSLIVGLPRQSQKGSEKHLYNSAAIIIDGKLQGYYDKILLPTYDVFSERRYFEPGLETKCWQIAGKKVAVIICEDQWKHAGCDKNANYARDPIAELEGQSPDLLINISASPYTTTKSEGRLKICSAAAKTLRCPIILCNQVGANDSLIFDGQSLWVSKEGLVIQRAKSFAEATMMVDLSHPEPIVAIENSVIEDIYQALVLGVRDYFHKSGFNRACLGLSGGIDSALVACIAVEALGKENVLALMMPSRYSSDESREDAIQLAETLDIAIKEIPIEPPFKSYLDLLSPHFEGMASDVTEENIQARIRGVLLMAFSNKLGYIVLSTANKSELAMGYSTLYGDLCGGLAVINDVTKQQVYRLGEWINRDEEIIPWSTIRKPPSAELRPNQKDSDSLPDYEIIDHVVCDYLEQHHSPEEIASKHHYPLDLVKDLIQKIHRSEYKRRQGPPGLRISEKAFSRGRVFPIVQRWV